MVLFCDCCLDKEYAIFLQPPPRSHYGKSSSSG
jgi:hypothetical protein